MRLVLIPKPVGRRSIVVYVGGGGFVVAEGERLESAHARDGANYRDGVEDIKAAAIRYLRANADKYGIDANAVAVWVESAGGCLAAMVGVANHGSAFEAGANLNQSSEVQGVILQIR